MKFAPILAVASYVALISIAEGQIVPSRTDNSANGILVGCKAFVDGRPSGNSQIIMMGNFCSGAVHGVVGSAEYCHPNCARVLHPMVLRVNS